MRVKVQKWGNSLAIRIPKAYADDLGVGADAEVELVQSRGRLVLTPIRRAEYRLSDLVAGITPKNVHGEVDSGPPVGREVL